MRGRDDIALFDESLDHDFTADGAGMDSFPADRREFLKILGGGILVFVSLGDAAVALPQGRRRFGARMPADFNAYLRIGEDGRVTGFTGKIEMGQGVITSLAQMLADELNVPLDAVDMVMGDTDLCPWDMGTFGSMTTRFFGPALRAAAAEARGVLMELASERLEAPVGELAVEDGVVFPRNRKSKRVTYAALAQGKKITRRLKGKAALEKVSDFTIVGRDALRRDARAKVTGEARFAADIRLPGMLYARILRPPAHGATLKSADTSRAEKIEGVRVVRERGLVAVLHEHPDVAEKALAEVEARFDEPGGDGPAGGGGGGGHGAGGDGHGGGGDGRGGGGASGADSGGSVVNDETIFDHLLEAAEAERVVARKGDVGAGEKLAATVIEGTFLNSYVSHAPMEPHAALAKVEGDRATVWASTQTPFRAKEEVARAVGVPSGNVRVITPFVGGGFGGKSSNRQVVEAAVLAKACGRPVQVAWTRAEEFFYDTFRPAAVVKIRSGVDGAGRIVSWDYHVYFAGSRGSEPIYAIPNQSTVSHGGGRGGPSAHPFATGPWRAPGNNTNTHARESQIDMMAARIGADPLEFRLKNLDDERMVRVLKAAAEKFGWTPGEGPGKKSGETQPGKARKRTPDGRGFGIACGIDSGTYVALMAEVEVDKKTGEVRVKRVVCAQDMGLAINPEGARIQMEGCVTMGLGYALTEEVRFRGGKILDRNFGTYKLPRFSWVPEIETVLIDAKESPPQGGGEPAIIAMGGVIANAVFDAAGVRLFQLPMTPDRVKKALEAV